MTDKVANFNLSRKTAEDMIRFIDEALKGE